MTHLETDVKYETWEVVERIKADLCKARCYKILMSEDLYRECMEYAEEGPFGSVGIKKDIGSPPRRLLIQGVLSVRRTNKG